MLRVFFQFIVICVVGFLFQTGVCSKVYAAGQPLDQIPDSLILLGNDTGKTEYALVVEKSSQQIMVYAYDGSYSEVLRFKCSTGKSPGSKMTEGDAKTPEGVYFFIKEHKQETLAPIYGNRAFPTDYPNEIDRAAGKTGNAIWLHGTNKPLKDFDSNGCIVLENADLDQIAAYIVLNKTPLIIVDRISYAPVEEILKEKDRILEWLSSRNLAIQKGTYHEYLEFYSPDYLPDLAWWREWLSIRKQLETVHRFFDVALKNIQILKAGQLLVILADQYLNDTAGSSIFAGKRKFFAEPGKSRYAIFNEAYVTSSDAIPGQEPLISAAQIEPKVEKNEEIISLVDDWMTAWASKDIDRYGSFYAKDFLSGDMTLADWLKYKNRLNTQNEFIRVSREKIDVQRNQTMISVTFVQKYESSSYKAVGKKQLILKQEEGKWKIHRETWTSL